MASVRGGRERPNRAKAGGKGPRLSSLMLLALGASLAAQLCFMLAVNVGLPQLSSKTDVAGIERRSRVPTDRRNRRLRGRRRDGRKVARQPSRDDEVDTSTHDHDVHPKDLVLETVAKRSEVGLSSRVTDGKDDIDSNNEPVDSASDTVTNEDAAEDGQSEDKAVDDDDGEESNQSEYKAVDDDGADDDYVTDLPEGWHGTNDDVWPKPRDWETYGFYRIRLHFKCSAYAHDQTKPLPSLEDWDLFKQTYIEVVDETATFDDTVPSTEGYNFADAGPPPYYAKHSDDGRGRGLFASRDIKEGELVHDGTKSDVMFHDGMSWRRYIFSLPRNKACDMIDWTWTQKLQDGKFHVFSAMNISILLNGGNEDTTNMVPESPMSSKFYATRDIAEGEELLTDYNIYPTVWRRVGLFNGSNQIAAVDITRTSGAPRSIDGAISILVALGPIKVSAVTTVQGALVVQTAAFRVSAIKVNTSKTPTIDKAAGSIIHASIGTVIEARNIIELAIFV